MKWLARFVIVLPCAVALWLLMPYLANFDPANLFGRKYAPWKLEMAPQASIAISYIAKPPNGLVFLIPVGADRIRIVSNGNLRDLDQVRRARAADPLKRWHYGLEIEVTDRSGKVLLKREHHHRVSFSEIRDPANRLITSAYYLNEELTPGNGVVLNIDLRGFEQAAQLRIRQIQIDPEFVDIGVRTYFPEVNDERRIGILWKRLSEKQRIVLANGNVYPQELLIEQERLNLLRHLWQPAGPQGVRGTDFNAREMYVLRDTDGEPEAEPIAPTGIISAPQQFAVFPIPEQGGLVHFEGQALQKIPSTQINNAVLKGRWYGDSTFARENFSLNWTGSGQTMKKQLGGGLVEIESPFPMALRCYIEINGQRSEITPERQYKRLFRADANQPVTFAIAHHEGQSTPIRLEARQLLPVTALGQPLSRSSSQTPALLRYEFLDADGKTLNRGTLPLITMPAPYDQVTGEVLGTRITEFTEVFFSVPPTATQIRLFNGFNGDPHIGGGDVAGRARSPLLVGLFSRPQGLGREIRAPEDQFAFASKGVKIPAWFAVRPDEYERLITNNQSQLVIVQSRPAEDKLEIQAGLYDFKDFRPQGAWLARQLLVPRDPNVPWRAEALVSTYEPLSSGIERKLEFPSYLGVGQLTPNLVWVGIDDAPFSGTVSIDGRVHHQFRGNGPYGETRLPPLASGRHRISVVISPQAGKPLPKLFINHVQPGRTAYTIQMAAIIGKGLESGVGKPNGKTLVFDIERTSLLEETVTARLFQPSNWGGRSRLLVRIEGPSPQPFKPMPGWMFTERNFDVRPDLSNTAPIFDTAGRRSDAGQPAYIPFPLNTPLGHYRLHFQLEQGPPGYLAVSRLTPGVAAQRRFLEEPEPRDVVIE